MEDSAEDINVQQVGADSADSAMGQILSKVGDLSLLQAELAVSIELSLLMKQPLDDSDLEATWKRRGR